MSQRHQRPRHITEAQRPAAPAHAPLDAVRHRPSSSKEAENAQNRNYQTNPGISVKIKNRTSRAQRNSVRTTPPASYVQSISQNEPEQLSTQAHSRTCGIEERPSGGGKRRPVEPATASQPRSVFPAQPDIQHRADSGGGSSRI